MKRTTTAIGLLIALMLVASPAFPFGKNKIAYDQFEWKIYHSTHFDVYFYETEKDSLQKVVNLAESAYDELSRKFNFQISKKVPLIFYATHSQFEQTNVELNFIPEGVGAFATPVRNRMVLPIDMPDQELLALIKHELTHIFQYEILFQGRLGGELRIQPPTWLMEGMASFMAEDESSKDRMVLRDAVVNDQIPSVTRDTHGFFAYRFGHAVFSYMLSRYGWDGVRDFIYEYRNTLGSGLAKPLKRAFDVTPEEFDTRFRTWLRKQYLPALISKGEPTEYGEPFRVGEDVRSQEISPVPAPSGDLLAALTTYKEDIDAVLFNIPKREMYRNLTKGLPEEYEYVVAQWMTTGPDMGRDVGFSPTGDQVAVFVKKEKGRSLLLVNTLSGRIERSIPMNEVEQQLSPTYSPDGKTIAFRAYEGNEADIFTYDLESGKLTNVTADPFFDGSPVFTPDGKSIVYSSVVDGGYAKLFRVDLANPVERWQITSGPSNDIDAFFSPDGTRVFFASDRLTSRAGEQASKILQAEENKSKIAEKTPPPDPVNFAAYNIYSLDLRNGDLLQYTDVVGGCFTPVVFVGQENKERIVFSSFYKGRWRLYTTTTDRELFEAEKTVLPSAPLQAGARTPFVPPVEVAIDPEKVEKYGKLRLFIDDVQVNAGVTSDQTFVSRSVIFTSDMLGDRRFIAALDSVSSFSNFDLLYLNMKKRLNWGVRLFDDRTFFVTNDIRTGEIDQQLLYRQTAAIGILSYPFDRYHRVDFGGGYMVRDYNAPVLTPEGLAFIGRSDDFPLVTGTFSGDNARFKEFGPISGRRYELTATYAPDIDEGGTLTSDVNIDFRQYLQMTSRSLLAARVFGGYATGNFNNYYYFGGLNTLRGYDFRTFAGDRAFYGNFEVRFPLVDVIATPVIAFTNIRGLLFVDVGGAWFEGQPFTFMEGGKLKDARGAVGWGFSVDVFGLELHWDFAKQTDFSDIQGGSVTSFWIGPTF